MRPNWWGVGISVGISAAIVLAIIAALVVAGGPPAGKDASAPFNIMALAIGGGAFGASWFGRVRKQPAKTTSVVRATAVGLEVNGSVVVKASDITSAVVRPAAGAGAFLRVTRGGLSGPLDVWVPRVEDARALVEALGFGAAQKASELLLGAISPESMMSRVRGTWLGGAVMVVTVILGAILARTLGPGVGAAAFGAGLLFHFAMLLRWVRPGRIVIGADGVLIRWLRHRELIRLADVTGAEVVRGETWSTFVPILVRIHLRGGGHRDVVAQAGRSSAFGTQTEAAWVHASTIAERINEAVRARAQGEVPLRVALVEDSLARAGREIPEWVASLRKLQDHVASFREHASTGHVLESLWSVLEDNAAPQEKRAAAAVALAPHLDDGGRERVRVAARAVAAPKLRIALEAAAERDDDDLVEALAEVEREESEESGATTTS